MASRRAFGYVRKLPSKRYQVIYVGPDGRRHKAHSTYLRKSDAEAWLSDEERIIDEGRWTPPETRRPNQTSTMDPLTLDEYARSNIRRRATRARKPLKQSTTTTYLQSLRLVISPVLGHLPLAAITPEHIRRWYDQLPDTPTQNGNAYNLLRSVLTDATEEGLITANPARIKGAGKPEPKRTSEALTAVELVAYIAAAPDRYRLPLALAAWCSLRSGEVRALRRCDVADDGTQLNITQGVTRTYDERPDGTRATQPWRFDTPKSTAGRRTVAVPPAIATGLAEWLTHFDQANPDRPTTQLLFPALNGVDPISDGTLRKNHKRAAVAIGRPTLTLHDLRRTGATLAGQSGATVKEIMRRLGHTKPDVAMLYQVADAARDQAVAQRMGATALPALE